MTNGVNDGCKIGENCGFETVPELRDSTLHGCCADTHHMTLKYGDILDKKKVQSY